MVNKDLFLEHIESYKAYINQSMINKEVGCLLAELQTTKSKKKKTKILDRIQLLSKL